uniref:Uncharacterized protein n=2 Tax=Clastoptera arizonana TaxID=38151 RepID=A0A1B6CTF6_9HEMI
MQNCNNDVYYFNVVDNQFGPYLGTQLQNLNESTQNDYNLSHPNLSASNSESMNVSENTSGSLAEIKDSLARNLTAKKWEEVINSAKSVFCKRHRTLLHWTNPKLSKTQLKERALSKWETISNNEKSIYISQVSGKIGFNNSILMVNPQLNISHNPPLHNNISEDQAAVNSILEPNEESEKRHYTRQSKQKIQKRKYRTNKSNKLNANLLSNDPQLKKDQKIWKKMRKAAMEGCMTREDLDLISNIEKFEQMDDNIDEIFWESVPSEDGLLFDVI